MSAAPPPYAPPGGQYPPQQGQYPPQQGQYPPPQQPGYPPPQQPGGEKSGPPGGYPPQGPPPGYPPQGQPPQGYPPQQPGYPQQQQHHTTNQTTVITAQPAIMSAVAIRFHEFPVALTCPSCRAQIVSCVHYDVGTMAWLLCAIMFIFSCWICCFIPFCVDSCKDAIHTCPNCSVTLGVYRRM